MIYFGYSVGFILVIVYDMLVIYFGHRVGFILVIEYDLFFILVIGFILYRFILVIE